MRAIRRILVAVKDPRSRSLPAVVKATQLARAFDAQLELFHGIATPLCTNLFASAGPSVAEVERSIRARYLGELGSIAERIRRRGLRVDVSADWDYPIHEAVVRRARQIKADLIVARQHEGRRLTPWLMHVTDWELLRLSPVPVLIVNNPRPYRRPVLLAAVDPGHAFSKPASLDSEILRMGALVSDALHGTLHAIHAYGPASPVAMTPEGLSMSTAERIETDARARATIALGNALDDTKIPPSRRHLLAGHPIDAIRATVRHIGSSITVMGAVSRSGLQRVFIGNTAERALAQLTCDVLVVKPKHFVSRVQRERRGARLVATAFPTL